ncbi:MAG: fibronectin type III domain-containing protein [Prevotellaceae bacterium]|jgi:chitodextrinase|nr:fibronectin type III domain-containing protein [Prevotellaceae bacterium]
MDNVLKYDKGKIGITGKFTFKIETVAKSTDNPTIWNICLTANPTSLSAPTASVSGAHPKDAAAGIYWDAATVSLSHSLGSAAIYYTTDGSEPNPAYDSLRYTAPFGITASTQVKAVAVHGSLTSPTLDSTITVSPTTFSFIVPKDASVFVGAKDQTVFVAGHYLTKHFIPFTEKQPAYAVDTLDGGTKKQVFYGVSGEHNYRVSMPGKLTHVGKFSPTATGKTLEVTQAQLDLHSPNRVDHDVTHHLGRNHADIYLNVNAAGHLRMVKDSSFYLMNIRVWQAINTDTENYFIEPDYRYSITNEQGAEDSSVVAIAPDGTLTAVGAGTAIVRVTYDAMMCAHTTNVGDNGAAFFSALWPENTGVFVVTVDTLNAPATGVSSNMRVNDEYWTPEDSARNYKFVDAEGDVFYYEASTGGFDFTFKPEGVAAVTLAQPALLDSILWYPNGFSSNGVTPHPDGSYTVRLVHGRNIVKLTNATGASEYQVISAKPATWTVSGNSGANNLFNPGDTISILFGTPGSDGAGYPLYHPHNKLSGIYNMSAGIQYLGYPTNFPLILGPNQYHFASRAQKYSIIIPDGYTGEEVALTSGVIKVQGFGSAFPAHRSITKVNGVPPNLNASVRTSYFGSVPSFYLRLTDNPSTPQNLTATPDGETALSLAWEPSRDNGSVVEYAVYANGALKELVAAAETSYDLKGLTPGTQYLIEVEATDNGGRSSAKAQATATTLDVNAPSVPTGLEVAELTETTATLAWEASTDNSGVVAGYIVYRNGDSVAQAVGTTCTLTGLTVVTAYRVAVAAVDAAGNVSDTSLISILTPDQTPPSKPGKPRTTGETATSVSLLWSAATDNVGVAGYLVTLNGDSVTSCTQNSVTVSDLPAAYNIGIQAVDAAGNRSEASYYSKDSEAPSAPAGLAVAPTDSAIALSWAASADNLGVVAGYVVYLSGDSVGFTAGTSYVFTGLTAATEYALAVAALDPAGNRSAQAPLTASTTDHVAPGTPSGLTATPAETSIALSWTASTDNAGVAGYVVYLSGDSVGFTANTSYAFTGLTAATEYALAVAAFDAAGNRSDTAQVAASTTASAPTGVRQVDRESAIAYPNPFYSYLVVKASAKGEVIIYNAQGLVALRANVGAGANRISTSALPQGVYILRCGALTQLLVKH